MNQSDQQPQANTKPWLHIAPAVADALATKRPVVGFETTVLSFGLPYPANIRVGHTCQNIAQEAGAQPATLGLLNGQVHVGLSDAQIEEFCAKDAPITKVNLQNFAASMIRKQAGAFTVAASMQVCAAAGIKVFATGGVGGVHTDYARLHDVSSDMLALTRYPVAVICAGVKSILDVPATIEQLETLGIPVIGYKTSRFPLFHARESLFDLESHSDSLEEIAQMVQAHWQMGGKGVLVVTPIPEAHAIPINKLEDWIAAAHRAAQIGRVTGKAVTPFLLKKMEELSHGKSMTSNVALLENNALTAAQLAHHIT